MKKTKTIFIKNILIYILLSKIFLKNCKVTLRFLRTSNMVVNLLKAPSRHKKFFHQIGREFFLIKIFYYFKTNRSVFGDGVVFIFYKIIIKFFKKINLFFTKTGSNILNKIKTTLICKTKFPLKNFLDVL